MVKVKKLYIVFLMITLIFALVSGGNLPYSIFYMTTAIVLIALFYSWSIYNNLSIDEVIGRRVLSAGEETEVTIRIYNESLMGIPYLEIDSFILKTVMDSYRGEAISVNGNSNKFITRKLKFSVRGIYKLGVSTFKAQDIFGLISLSKGYENIGEVIVYPKVYPMNVPKIQGGNVIRNENYLEKSRSYYGSGNETIRNIREYVPGDNYKRVNWKVSAKHGKLYVKEYEDNEGPRVNIFLDFRRQAFLKDAKGIEEEKLVEFFLSITAEFIKDYGDTGAHILSDDSKDFLCVSEVNINEMKEYFLRSYSKGEGSISDYLHGRISKIRANSSVVIVTNDIRNEDVEYLNRMNNGGYRVTVFYSRDNSRLENADIYSAVGKGITFHAIEEIV